MPDYGALRLRHAGCAERGSAEAQCSLAALHEHGQGGQQDYAEARRLYSMAAAQGHARSQYFLAAMHADGQGGALDHREARRLYGLAATQGHARSQYVLEIYAKMVLMGSIFHVFMVSGHTGWGEGRSVAMLARARALLLPPPWISRVPSR